MKKSTIVLLALVLACALAACKESDSANDSYANIAPGSSPDSVAATAPSETTALVLEGNTYILTALNAEITVAEEYSVYALNSGFTEQMCQAQGINSADKMTQYLQLCGDDMYLLPNEDAFLDPTFIVSVRIKEKDYGCENLKDLNALEFKQLAASLVAGFGVGEYTVYENDVAKYVVFNCKILEDECRYATILDGKMVYFTVQTDGKTAPADHHARVCTILDTLKLQ